MAGYLTKIKKGARVLEHLFDQWHSIIFLIGLVYSQTVRNRHENHDILNLLMVTLIPFLRSGDCSDTTRQGR